MKIGWDIKGSQVKYSACWNFCRKPSQAILMSIHKSIASKLLATSVQGLRLEQWRQTLGRRCTLASKCSFCLRFAYYMVSWAGFAGNYNSWDVWDTMYLQWSNCNSLLTIDYLRLQLLLDRNTMHITMYESLYESLWKPKINGENHLKIRGKLTHADIKGSQVKYSPRCNFCCKQLQAIWTSNRKSITSKILVTSVQGLRLGQWRHQNTAPLNKR